MSRKGADCTMTLRLYQFNLNLVGERRRTSGRQRYLLDVQVIDDFRVAVKMHGEGRAVERVGEEDSGAVRGGVARAQRVPVLLARQSGAGPVIFQQVVQAQHGHAPGALARPQVNVGFAAIGPHGGFAYARLLHLKSAWLDEVAMPVKDDLAVLTNGGHYSASASDSLSLSLVLLPRIRADCVSPVLSRMLTSSPS